MKPNSLDKYLEIATFAAKSGGKILEQFWGKLKDIQKKEFNWDLVTEADKKSEEKIIEILKKEFPNHSILAEESGLHSIEGTNMPGLSIL
jgi:myo-inositol-1(or 4)-monophosphatase